jgi:translocator protein
MGRDLIGLAGGLAVGFIAATAGAVASVDAAAFYAQLARPPWAPPGSVFAPVWTVLYALMGVSAWLVWRERGAPLRRPALAIFLAQLAANALWSWLFFHWKNGALAFAEVLILLPLIAVTVALFWRVRRLAAVLLVPYLAWVACASALTWAVWRANPGLL